VAARSARGNAAVNDARDAARTVPEASPVGIALVGCGFVADYYMSTLALHDGLRVVGVFDRDAERLHRFSAHHGVPAYHGLSALLDDGPVEIVVNLTNPREHRDVTRAALEAGKHVYSEKPLAMDLAAARQLVELADARGLVLSSAPCSLLGETAQTVWRAVRDGAIGPVRLVYAEMDEGMVFDMPYRRWSSASGAPWPYRDEFEVGTTIEHAGYVVSWLPAMFGSARTVSGFSACLFPDKGRDGPLPVESPDLAVACITFDSGVIARLTCSLIAPHDHSLRVVGDDGVLGVTDTWFYTSPVTIRRWFNIKGRHVERPWRQRYPLVAKGQRYRYRGTQQMDFGRGVADLADAVRTGRQPRLSSRYSLHVNEIVLAVSSALGGGGTYQMTTSIDPVEPMPWATTARPSIGRRVTAAIRKGPP
jgi:predicted dehydrogenase